MCRYAFLPLLILLLPSQDRVDALCRALTSSWVRQQQQQAAPESKSPEELCEFFEGFEATGRDATLTGIYSLDDLKALGRTRTWCPYFLARHFINFSNVVVFNYQVNTNTHTHTHARARGGVSCVFDVVFTILCA
jgi:DNA excision repair protein ERCC-2